MKFWETMILQRKLKGKVDDRRLAAERLGEYKGERAVSALRSVLNDPDSGVRMRAVKSLGRIGTTQAADALLSVFQISQFYDLELEAARALVEMNDTRVEKHLMKFLKFNHRVDEVMRLLERLNWQPSSSEDKGILALSNSRWEEAAMYMGNSAYVPIVNALNDRNVKNVEELTNAVAGYESEELVQELINAVRRGKNPNALRALSKMKSPKSLPLILEAISEPNSALREEAVSILLQMGPRVVESLANMVVNRNSPEEKLKAVLGVLDQIDQSAAVKALSTRLRTGFYSMVVEDLLVQYGALAVKPLLAEFKNGLTESAANVLGRIGDASAVDPLVSLLCRTDPREHAIQPCIQVLGQLGDERAIEPLLDIFRMPDDSYIHQARTLAAKALGKIGSIEAISLLIENLSDIHYVGDSALEALSEILKRNPDRITEHDLERLARLEVTRYEPVYKYEDDMVFKTGEEMVHLDTEEIQTLARQEFARRAIKQ